MTNLLRFSRAAVVALIALLSFAALSSAPGTPTYIDLNSEARAIAAAQNVVVGSSAWAAGGNHPYGGGTGEHPCYGWRHWIRIAESADLRRAMIANAAARPQFYLPTAPTHFRSDYEGAGRPKPWTWTADPDLKSGGYRYIVSKSALGSIASIYPDVGSGYAAVDVTGIEGMHWWPEGLAELAKFGSGRGWTLKAPFAGKLVDVDAGALARVVLQVQTSTVVGALNGGYERTHAGNERWAARLLEGSLSAWSAGALAEADAETLAAWLDQGLLREWALAPGASLYSGNRPGASPAIPPGREVALVWQWAWAGASLERLAGEVPSWAPRARPIAKRFLTWVVEAIDKRGDGKIPVLVSFEPGVLGASSLAAMPSLASLLASGKATVHDEYGYDFGPWIYRPLRFAASMKIAGAAELATAIDARTPRTAAWSKWMVDDAGKYVRSEDAARDLH